MKLIYIRTRVDADVLSSALALVLKDDFLELTTTDNQWIVEVTSDAEQEAVETILEAQEEDLIEMINNQVNIGLYKQIDNIQTIEDIKKFLKEWMRYG